MKYGIFFQALLVWVVGIVGCVKPKSNKNAEVLHRFSEISGERYEPLLPCDSSTDKPYPKAATYAQAVLDHIIKSAAATGLTTFTNNLAIDNFCIIVEQDADDNAFSNSITGAITITTALFLLTPNDASFAYALAHEMAHITLNNSLSMSYAYDKITSSQDVQLLQALDAKYEELRQKYQQAALTVQSVTRRNLLTFYRNKINTCKEEYRKIISKYFTAEEIANKNESDADEIALELMARAGFEPKWAVESIKVDMQRDEFSTDTYAQCMQQTDLAKIERGTFDHPSNCWRLRNMEKEIAMHAKDYALFLEHPIVNIIDATQLVEVKKEIKGME